MQQYLPWRRRGKTTHILQHRYPKYVMSKVTNFTHTWIKKSNCVESCWLIDTPYLVQVISIQSMYKQLNMHLEYKFSTFYLAKCNLPTLEDDSIQNCARYSFHSKLHWSTKFAKKILPQLCYLPVWSTIPFKIALDKISIIKQQTTKCKIGSIICLILWSEREEYDKCSTYLCNWNSITQGFQAWNN